MVATPILDHLAALAEPIRTRLLLVLEDRELTVSELCTVLQLPQSTVSRHLKALGDAGWVGSRAQATSRLYRMSQNGDPATHRLWALVRDQAATSSSAFQDHHRLQRVLADRRTKSQQFFESSAGEWDRLREELFGGHVHLSGLVALLDEAWVVGDLGCGTGSVSAALAPFVRRVIAVDDSGAMLAAARKRLRGYPNVGLKRGRLESLPIERGSLDAAALTLVLHHVPDPAQALREVSRVLRPGGRVLILDMLPHDRESYSQQMGHVWLGFSEAQMTNYVADAGFDHVRTHPLPAEPSAKGPALFVATAKRA
ncbi:MAG: metalloregulator ArsR/SmtB family transcription factor [Acidobacteria bacterium]|nr:metalloregulator ArsR/SmtB family transcription factor [Acidobacteriota bacterium]